METLRIHGNEQSLLDPTLADGGIPPALGVQSFQVFRASRDVPEQTDGKGWTYHHHVDMACWKGRLYVGWNSCEKDEDVWPARELYSSSTDGAAWSNQQEMFPQGVSTCLRIYFYLGKNDRMLAIAGLRADIQDTSEDKKGGLVVREIRSDHTLGDIFTLQSPKTVDRHPPIFEDSPDSGFKDACRQLLADKMFLEQQDRGRLLGPRRMKWHDAASWPGGKVPGDNPKWVCGKAFSFYQRPDGAWVGISKMGWTTLSRDAGQNWDQPAVPPTLITGKAKVWSQRTADGRFVLVYNPSKSNRFPLIAVTGDDGINFSHMRIIQGELPVQRYAGLHRSIGPQYIRGISHWANDGSRPEKVLWLVYSINKEDIWVSRVPLPVASEESKDVHDDFRNFPDGPLVKDWNTYSPKWAGVRITGGALHLENRDPYDYAQATRLFPESSQLTASFELSLDQPDRAHLEIDLLTKFGSRRPAQIVIGKTGNIAPFKGRAAFEIKLDAPRATFSVSLNGAIVLRDAKFFEPAEAVHRIAFRTGPHRGIGGAHPVLPGTDSPAEIVSYRLYNLAISRSH